MSYKAAQDRAIELARLDVGIHEEGGKNRGRSVDAWNQRVSNALGSAWCVAFGWTKIDDACRELGLENPLPRCGSVAKMFHRVNVDLLTDKPARGLFLHFTEATNTWGTGHFGFVDFVTTGTPGWLNTIEGNTGRDGSRDGDSVWTKKRSLEYGYRFIDISRLDPVAHAPILVG